MRTHTPAAVLSGVGLATVAAAQTPVFQYSIQANFNPYAPGSTGIITILCGFTPGIGEMVSTPLGPRPVLGLSSGGFDFFVTAGGWKGFALAPPYNAAGTSAGAVVGSSVNGILWANGAGPPVGAISTMNPTPLWSGTYMVPTTNQVLIVNPVGLHAVWAGNPGEPAMEVLSSQTIGAQWVTPAPASFAVFALAGLITIRRRRTGPPDHESSPCLPSAPLRSR